MRVVKVGKEWAGGEGEEEEEEELEDSASESESESWDLVEKQRGEEVFSTVVYSCERWLISLDIFYDLGRQSHPILVEPSSQAELFLFPELVDHASNRAPLEGGVPF